jgi:hypothetical protein
MGCTIDHLEAGHCVTVIRDFADARGESHRAGETAVLKALGVDLASGCIRIDWEREGRVETLVFELASRSGPGNGRMREYFEVSELAQEAVRPPSVAPEPPPVEPEVIRDPSRRDDAFTRVDALACTKRFAEAEEQLRAIGAIHADLVARELGAAAERRARDDDPSAYEWLRDRAIDHWYAWGSEATSGGDGAARLLEIRPAMIRFEELDRTRAARERPTALDRFRRSMEIDYEKWHDGVGYDLDAIRSASPDEREAIERLLVGRATSDWRDVQALAVLDTPGARAALREAMRSAKAEIRLAVSSYAPEVLEEDERTTSLVAALESAEFFGGLTQALAEAEEFHPPEVVDALFRGALRRDGPVAVHCAALLMFIHGKAEEPFDMAQRPFFLTFHATDPAERRERVRELCAKVGVDADDVLARCV